MAQTMSHHKQQLPSLPYDLGALEPVINGEIMDLHYNKHHAAYVNNLNGLLEKYWDAEERNDLATMIALSPGIKFNGGGHVNHSIFWTNLAPQDQGGGEPPKGELAKVIDSQWGSLDNFIEKFNGIAGPIQGSGWAWLAYCNESGRLRIVTCANQDPCSLTGTTPLLGIDVWEHAYYLQYKNARPAYLKAIWGVVNWANVAERYAAAKR
jgi:superoxide dismutase, Fe-Mn family